MVHMDSLEEELESKNDLSKASQAHDINNIILYPFAHQVGGHTQLLTLDKSTLCKPLIPRELLFYLNVPKELLKFVPSYKGVVQIRETGTGTYPPVVYQPLRSPKSPFAKFGPGSSCTLPAKFGARLSINKSNLSNNNNVDGSEKLADTDTAAICASIESNHIHNHEPIIAPIQKLVCSFKTHQLKSKTACDDHLIDLTGTSNRQQIIHIEDDGGKTTHQKIVNRGTRSSSEENSNESSDLSMGGGGYFSEDSNQSITDLCGSPMELKVQIKQCSDEKILKKNLSQDNLLRADHISRPNEKYLLLLENVASRYQLPCILDLKMGTRQHSDDATEEKRHRQIAKCQASTSASLGVRLCGMQVYQVDYGGFLWYDKYYGRKMDEEGLKRALHQYFHNGFQLNEDIIDDVIARLKLLSNAVEKSPSFRFYGTSLLIIHEGSTSRSVNSCPVDVRLIDFAHTICDYSNKNNGRCSSSPSVLRSSSAENLDLCSSLNATINDHQQQNLESKQQQISADTNIGSADINENDADQSLTDQFHLLTKDNSVDPSFRVELPLRPATTSENQINTSEMLALSNSNPTTPHGLSSRKISSKSSIGPDKGLLFGLENLVKLLGDLKIQYHNQKEQRQPVEEALGSLYIPVN